MSYYLPRSLKTSWKCKFKINRIVLPGIISLLVIFVILGSVFADGLVRDSGGTRTGTTGIPIDTPGTGFKSFATYDDVIRTPQFEISIDSITEKQTVGTKYVNSVAPEDFVYLVVTWLYKGIADEPIMAFPSPTIELLDMNNTRNESDSSASGSYAAEINLDREVFSELKPGVNVRNAHVFAVPKEQFAKGGWRLHIIADTDHFININ